MPATRITVEDLLDLRFPGDAQIHPTRPLVAFVVTSGVTKARESNGPSRIWLSTTDGSAQPRPVTAEGTRASHPRWSPDGARLAFLANGANREGVGQDQTQLHVLDETWGAATQLTDCAGGVSTFGWSPDRATLTLLVTDPPPADEKARHERGADQVEYETAHRFNRLWSLDAHTQQLTQLSHADANVFEFAQAPGPGEIVALVADEPYNWSWYGARLALLERATGDFTTLHESRKQYTSPAWSPDGAKLAVIHCTWSDQGMTGGDVLLLERAGASPRLLTDGHPRSYLNALWDPAGSARLCCAAIEDGEAELGWLSLDGEFEIIWRAPAGILYLGDITSIDAAGQRAALTISDPSAPPEPHVIGLTASAASPRRLTDLNPVTRERELPHTTTLHWRSSDGQIIQGLLARPARAGDAPLPTVVQVHGGPTSLWQHSFNALRSTGWVPLLTAAGYAVLLPNPRGSMGFGTAFAEANVGDMGGADWADVMAGVDYCVAEGLTDPNRLALAGWSYGGYMTAWGVTQTTRFKAAVAGASITNWISFHGVSTIPGFDATFYPGDPFNWGGPYAQFSPMLHLRNVQTPTLFLHGEHDPICPVGQAHEMWRALKELGVETQLVVYPREGHGIREREHARDVLERAVAWITERV
jgi:dipeptidyl aminopeptidase/acylaminoacyl peptidase